MLFRSEGVYKYNLFSQSVISFGDHEQLISKSYPLHPVTIILLPKFSQLFGQNERTLFTFLYDESKYGFKGYVLHQKGLYYPDLLVDFFFSGSEEKYNDNYKDVVIYKKLYNQLVNLFDVDEVIDAQRILKFILLWNITNSNSIFVISKSLISFALGIDVSKVEKIIDDLLFRKIVRINLIHRNYEIIEASSVDLELEINKALVLTKQKLGALDSVVNYYNPFKTVYPKIYNYQNDTVRFCSVFISIESEYPKDLPQADIYLVFSFEETLFNKDERTFHGHLSSKKKEFIQIAQRLAAIDLLLSDRHFISEFKNVDIDLQYEKDKILINLEIGRAHV